MAEIPIVRLAGSFFDDGPSDYVCPHCGYKVGPHRYIDGDYDSYRVRDTRFCPQCGFQYFSKSKFADGKKCGYWVADNKDIHCSECGDIVVKKYTNKYDPSISSFRTQPHLASKKYCRVCGAKMVDSQEELNHYMAEHNQLQKNHTFSSHQLKRKEDAKWLLQFFGKIVGIVIALVIVLLVLSVFM